MSDATAFFKPVAKAAGCFILVSGVMIGAVLMGVIVGLASLFR